MLSGQRQPQKRAFNPLVMAALLATAYWLLETLLDMLTGTGPLLTRLLPVGTDDFGNRLIVVVLLLAFGWLAEHTLHRETHRQTQEEAHHRDLTFLSQSAMDFIELPADEDMYVFIAQHLKQLVGNAIVVTCAYNREEECLRIAAIECAEHERLTLLRAIGANPVGMSFPVIPAVMSGMSTGKLAYVPGGLDVATMGMVPTPVAQQIGHELQLENFYAIGFTRKGGLFGDAVIITHAGETLPNTNVIEAFINQASVALQRRRAEEDLRRLSLTDELTGLYNRRGFFTLAEQQVRVATRSGRGMMLVYVDLDGMKSINDTHGHSAGDTLLIQAADILRHTFRSADLVARVGGDEFVALVLDVPADTRDMLADRLRDNMVRLGRNPGIPHGPIGMSIGFVYFDPDAPCTVDELLTRADAAMYEVKREHHRSMLRA